MDVRRRGRLRNSNGCFLAGIAAVVSAIGLTSPVFSDDCLPVLGRWSYGPTDTVEVSGSVAYFNSGAVLKIAEISDASQPVVVGEIDIEDIIEDLVVSGGHAFVVSHGSRYLSAIDVQDPEDPRVVGRLQLAEGWWVVDADLKVDGTMVYLGDHGLRIVAIDVADPRYPEVVGTYELPPDPYGTFPELLGFSVSGGLAYVTVARTNQDPVTLRVINFSSPSTPVEIGRIENPFFTGTSAVSISGDDLYLSAFDGFHVIDISEPTVPVDVGMVAGYSGADQIVSQGEWAFSAHDRGLRIYDVSDPSDPMFLANSLEGEAVFDVALGDQVALVALGDGGLQVLDVGSPSLPSIVGGIQTPVATEVIAAYEDIVYRVKDTGLQVFRVTPAGLPVELRYVELGLRPGSIALVDGEFLYLTVSGRQGVAIVSLASPRHPQLKGLIDQPVVSFGVEESKVYAWVSATGFVVFDVTDQTSPVEIGRIEDPGGDYDQISVSGGLAIAIGYGYPSDAVRMIDVSDPTNPEQVHVLLEEDFQTVRGAGLHNGIAVLGMAGDEGRKLRSYDVHDPTTPVLIESVSAVLSPRMIRFAGRRVIVMYAYHFVQVFDTMGSGGLHNVGDYLYFRSVEGIAVADHSFYLALGPIGFVAHDLSVTCEPPRPAGGRATGHQIP
jgi:hypothetical protein